MPRCRLAALSCMVALLVCGAAHAFPITFSFTGSVTDDPFGLSSFDAPITGSYTFESTATDAIPSPSTGSYPSIGPAYGFTANVDGTPYSVSGSLIVNTANDIGVDQYGVIAIDAGLTLEIFFEDSTQTALSSDALPLVAPSITSFGFRQFRLFSADAEFLGDVDRLSCSAGCGDGGGGNGVPEPGMLWLLGAALMSLALTRRKTVS